VPENIKAPQPRAWMSLEWLAVIAALLVIGFGVYFTFFLTFSGRPLPHGLRKPILAMEVPSSADDIRLVLGCGVGETKTVPCGDPLDKQDRYSMRLAQYVDWAFIPCYAALFAAAGLIEWKTIRSGWRWLGILALVAVIVAAGFDYGEDSGIFRALDKARLLQSPDWAAIAFCGWWKWTLLFIVLLCLIPMMIARGEKSMTFRIISRLLCLFVAVSALAGLLACWLHHPARLESAASGLAAIPALILFRAFLRGGTLQGLEWLASLPGLKWLARWPDFLFGKEPELESSRANGSGDPETRESNPWDSSQTPTAPA